MGWSNTIGLASPGKPEELRGGELKEKRREVKREERDRVGGCEGGRQVRHTEEKCGPACQHRGQLEASLPHQAQIQEEVQRLIADQLHGFQYIDTTDDALRKNVANLNRSPFIDKVEQTEPPRKFSPLHFTLFKRDEDLNRHLMHYRRAMTLYANNDALMCKIFTTTLQGEAQDWFHNLLPRSIWNFSELSLVFTKEYSLYQSIKKKSDHLFNMKKDLKESLRTYVKRFKAEKAKIVRCDDSIACSAFRKRLLANHPLFKELIMGENLTLANSYALA
ncbi:uncharacterized protein LOC125476676 [Pyrus x bretschneideri]|uniref:uncharacterized protein LOC125476676 n=1 Tax=Pyrus x bretschneideri TaxID=225117 RepID=UPI00202DF76A|nr:uncharacterized protein LOC125476676 [Pyrus x bretschneideri]